MLTTTETLYGSKTVTAHVEPGKTVRLVGTSYDRTFKVGDTVIHGSYNLEYTGKIVSIGPKTVAVDTGHGGRKRMKIQEFAFYNHNLDLDATAKRNHEIMMCI